MKENSSGKKALIIISKLPSYSKTRLELPPKIREAFYTLCIKSTIQKCLKLKSADTLVSYFPSSDSEEMKRICGNQVAFFSADRTDFGGALIDSYMYCFSSGYSVVGNIAPDSPDTPVSYLSKGLNLYSNDIVIGPTADGGYYFLCMRSSSNLAIFSRVDWGTEKVFGQLISNAQSHHLKIRVLPMWYDVDNIHDIYVLRNHLFALQVTKKLEPYLNELTKFLCNTLTL